MVKRYTNYDLSGRNTFRMKVRCALYVEVTEEADLLTLDWDALPQPVMVMGGGSNLLFTGNFPGTILHVAIHFIDSPVILSASEESQTTNTPEDKVMVNVGSGVEFDQFCAWAAAQNLWGPENLSLIPGECGASAVQNIGAYGVEAKDIISEIRAFDKKERVFVTINPAQCAYGYRTSRFKTDWKGRYVITAVTYCLSRTPQPKLDYGGVRKALEMRSFVAFAPQDDKDHKADKQRPLCHSERSEESPLTPQIIRDTIIGIRNQKLPDPAVTGSAGSFFCNPVIDKDHFARIVAAAQKDNGPDYQVPHYEVGDRIKVPAAWMIEQCGFKGAVNGGAQVYPKQPLVIVNASGSATPQEVIGLEQQVIAAIEAKYGITLHPEVEHI